MKTLQIYLESNKIKIDIFFKNNLNIRRVILTTIIKRYVNLSRTILQ